jgi:hypothetical protein
MWAFLRIGCCAIVAKRSPVGWHFGLANTRNLRLFVMSAATAILGRSPVLQFFSDDQRENLRKFRWGKNEKRSFCV